MIDFILSVSAKKVFYSLQVGLIIAALILLFTNTTYGLMILTLLGGLLGIIRPRIILDFFEEETKRKHSQIYPLFGEKTYKFIGYISGVFLIALTLTDAVLMILNRKPLFF